MRAVLSAFIFLMSSLALAGTLYQEPIDINVDQSLRTPAQVYLPKQYNASQSWPLVVLLHGFSGTAKGEDLYLGLRFRASKRGFILLTPEGITMPQGTKGVDGRDLSGYHFWNAIPECCDFGRTGVNDVGYLLGLIEKVKSAYKVDKSRIYIIGHSNGGFMANRLACEAGDQFAGVMNLAGGTYLDSSNCRTQTPIRYLQVHATNDKTILYNNAPTYSGAVQTVSAWLSRNNCPTNSINTGDRNYVALIPGTDTTRQLWYNCRTGKDVAFWTIKAHEGRWHNAHVPLFNWNFMEEALDFLMAGTSR